MSDTVDHRFMRLALSEADKVLYRTDPNPRVGCVIVSGDDLVGAGGTQRVGGPHAEIVALREAGARAQGATLYVTLEPCCHHGRTPPCTDAIISAGIKRVVAALQDPDPRVAGKGFKALTAAGIDVQCGPGADMALSQNIGFFQRLKNGLPFVRVKVACSLDGRTALANGESQWITGSAAREDVHHWRARSSAIVTGSATIIADDAQLTARPNGDATDNDKSCIAQPLRVVMATHANIPVTAKVLTPPESCLLACVDCSAQDAAQWQKQGVEVVHLAADKKQGVAALALLHELAGRDVNEVWVEAGATLAGCFLAQGLVDELFVYIAPKLLGENARPMARIPDPQRLNDVLSFNAPQCTVFGDDIRLIYSKH